LWKEARGEVDGICVNSWDDLKDIGGFFCHAVGKLSPIQFTGRYTCRFDDSCADDVLDAPIDDTKDD